MPTAGGYGVPFNQSTLMAHPDQKVLDMKDEIYYLNPSQTPMLTIMNAMGKNPAKQVNFHWQEDEYLRRTAGKALIEDLGNITTASGAKYHFLRLTLSRTVEREAFEQSKYIKLGTTTAVHTEHNGELLDSNGVEQSDSTFWNDLFKVTLYGVDGATARSCFVLSPNFYATQTAAVQTLLDSLGVTAINGTNSSPQDIITRHNQVYCIVDPQEGTKDDPATDWSGYSTSTYFNFRTFAPSAQKSGWAEGSGLGGESVKRVRFNDNITEIFKTPFSISGSAMEEMLYGGETQYNRLAARAGAKHKLLLEYKFLTNGYMTGKGTETRTTSGLGLMSSTPSSGSEPLIHTKNGSYQTAFQWDWDHYVDPQENLFALYDIFSAMIEDSDVANSAIMVSPKWNNIIHKLAMQTDNAQLMYGPDAQLFGVRFRSLRTPDADITFVLHREVLRGPYEDYALWLDFSQMELRPLGNRDTKLFQDVASKEIDGRVDYYMTEIGMEVRNEGKHAILKLV